ncbi:GNAT family N-acetyltransferase [Nostoc sp. FACHB-152]|uniref:GNAT family N-acetyltransferase n=1 Tax=unclassified Nostoc TaxID=2593658 RepID=UPI001686866E|nr:MULTISPECIES: GNAT family N-acetyltransferase [unclassified Nostoc]MBD2448928.1 GNAT family N-acetyltransferase [Nostoc sp. FACHB-152]MBD2471182.1 GNAT family N-acetyltransferase [Nostoc sp. FACHB-145]
MDDSIRFLLENAAHTVKKLGLSDEKILQQLYEQCTDYAILTDGHPPLSSAAAEEFLALPEGKTIQDKFILGLFAPDDTLVGMLETIRHYPDEKSWWIGLMMLSPEHRGKGLGSQLYQAYETWVIQQSAQFVCLAVLEENQPGFNFWQKLGFEVIRIAPPQQFGNKVHRRYVLRRQV